MATISCVVWRLLHSINLKKLALLNFHVTTKINYIRTWICWTHTLNRIDRSLYLMGMSVNHTTGKPRIDLSSMKGQGRMAEICLIAVCAKCAKLLTCICKPMLVKRKNKGCALDHTRTPSLFFCLFVCCYKTRKSVPTLGSPWEGSTCRTPGSIS